ncbi:MAG: hypothetical protein BWX70_02226 [Verrucomicrobia bacterium ADurb.Bin070]|nr:MAG: hypothetical protein BWX70_02226 [Verrucomicrobia bacterium ADurb.Bin070]
MAIPLATTVSFAFSRSMIALKYPSTSIMPWPFAKCISR